MYKNINTCFILKSKINLFQNLKIKQLYIKKGFNTYKNYNKRFIIKN